MWQGKYDEDGVAQILPECDRREVDIDGYTIDGCTMPLQMIYQRLNITPQQLKDFCQKWNIAELAVFGSILRDDFRHAGENPSDIDLLFRYLPNTNMSLLSRAKMKIELETLCRRSIDLVMITEVVTSHNSNRKKQILASARLIYAQG